MLDSELEWQPRREAPISYFIWVSTYKKWKDNRVVENPMITAAQAIQVKKLERDIHDL